jgi:redox-sensitive bicupin YhaK (pirin superfamily)
MSLPHIPDPMPGDAAAADAIEMVIVPRARDLGGFEVRRALPAAGKQMVGPFIFFDQFGPVLMKAGQGIDVRPHPHIGLSTVTWLFDGAIYHRDSLGSSQSIAPGELNWMTAGKGIVHSERTAAPDLARDRNVFGIQSWVALPKQHEETAPAFEHVAMEKLPLIADKGITARVVAGSLYGATSPVKTHSDLFYADVQVLAGAALPLPVEHEERGVYLAEGEIEVAGQHFAAGRLLVFRPGDAITLRAVQNARVMLLGGEPMDGPRHIWWNFVSSSKDRIEAAKDDWKRARFGIVPGDEADFIPLPDK